MKIGLDTNILIELVVKESLRHRATWVSYEEYKRGGAQFVIADQGLLEAFSVLTRAPKPVSMPAQEAQRVLRENFGTAQIAPVHSGFAWDAIGHTLSRGHWSGRVYDAVIALGVYEAGARLLLTWNVRHLITVAPVGLEVRAPQSEVA